MRKNFILTLLPILILASVQFSHAQQAKKAIIGILTLASDDPLAKVLREGLRDLGYVEGQNIVFEHRYVDGKVERLSDLAADLVRMKVDVIVARSTPVVQAVKKTTTTIPVVISVPDSVGSGFVASLARPGGILPARPPSCRSWRASGWSCSEKFFQSYPGLRSWRMGAIRRIPGLSRSSRTPPRAPGFRFSPWWSRVRRSSKALSIPWRESG